MVIYCIIKLCTFPPHWSHCCVSKPLLIHTNNENPQILSPHGLSHLNVLVDVSAAQSSLIPFHLNNLSKPSLESSFCLLGWFFLTLGIFHCAGWRAALLMWWDVASLQTCLVWLYTGQLIKAAKCEPAPNRLKIRPPFLSLLMLPWWLTSFCF